MLTTRIKNLERKKLRPETWLVFQDGDKLTMVGGTPTSMQELEALPKHINVLIFDETIPLTAYKPGAANVDA